MEPAIVRAGRAARALSLAPGLGSTSPLPLEWMRLDGVPVVDEGQDPSLKLGNVVFFGDSNRRFRAFDAETGTVLWETILGSQISGFPVTYAPRSGAPTSRSIGRTAPDRSVAWLQYPESSDRARSACVLQNWSLNCRGVGRLPARAWCCNNATALLDNVDSGRKSYRARPL